MVETKNREGKGAASTRNAGGRRRSSRSGIKGGRVPIVDDNPDILSGSFSKRGGRRKNSALSGRRLALGW